MKSIAKLYKKNTKGAIQQWEMFVYANTYWAEHGLIDGAITRDRETICSGKNIGRANATTPAEQAAAEAAAKVQKKLDSGYVPCIEDVDKVVFKPTLAHTYDKHGHKLPDLMYASPKLDGIRCLFTKDGAFSRNNKKFEATKILGRRFRRFFELHPDAVLDGELYNHGFKEDFNKIVSMVRRTKNFTSDHWREIEKHLEFHIFDAWRPDLPKAPFSHRTSFVNGLVTNIGDRLVKPVEHRMIHRDHVDRVHDEYLEQGYEGIMLRCPKAPYEHKRSYKLQKHKIFVDEEFEIIDVEEGQGNWSGCAKMLLFKNPDGEDFKATLTGAMPYCRQLLLDKDEYSWQNGYS